MSQGPSVLDKPPIGMAFTDPRTGRLTGVALAWFAGLAPLTNGPYVPIDGSVAMTGPLVLPGNAANPLEAVPKQQLEAVAAGFATVAYVDAADALRLRLSGGTMTGKITLDGDPTAALHAATKQYVDGHAGEIVAYEEIATPVSDVDLDHTFEAGYAYRLRIDGLVMRTDGQAPYLRAKVSGTPDSSAVYDKGVKLADAVAEAAAGQNQMLLAYNSSNQPGNASGEHFNCAVDIANAHSTSLHKGFHGTAVWARSSDGRMMAAYVGGGYRSTSALSGLYITSGGATPGFSAGLLWIERRKVTP